MEIKYDIGVSASNDSGIKLGNKWWLRRFRNYLQTWNGPQPPTESGRLVEEASPEGITLDCLDERRKSD